MNRAHIEDRSISEAKAIRMAKRWARCGWTLEQILSNLVGHGVDPGIASFVAHQHTRAPRSSQMQAMKSRISGGCFLMLVGLGVVLFLSVALGTDRARLLSDEKLSDLNHLNWCGYCMLIAGIVQFLRGLSLPPR
jgi:hypothetical protein